MSENASNGELRKLRLLRERIARLEGAGRHHQASQVREQARNLAARLAVT